MRDIIFVQFFRYTDNKVFVALSHGELCVFRREMSKELHNERQSNTMFGFVDGHWDLDHPIVQSIEESSSRQSGENDDGDTIDPISVMALAAGRLWCAIRDKIFVVCPNSLTVEVIHSRERETLPKTNLF